MIAIGIIIFNLTILILLVMEWRKRIKTTIIIGLIVLLVWSFMVAVNITALANILFDYSFTTYLENCVTDSCVELLWGGLDYE